MCVCVCNVLVDSTKANSCNEWEWLCWWGADVDTAARCQLRATERTGLWECSSAGDCTWTCSGQSRQTLRTCVILCSCQWMCLDSCSRCTCSSWEAAEAQNVPQLINSFLVSKSALVNWMASWQWHSKAEIHWISWTVTKYQEVETGTHHHKNYLWENYYPQLLQPCSHVCLCQKKTKQHLIRRLNHGYHQMSVAYHTACCWIVCKCSYSKLWACNLLSSFSRHHNLSCSISSTLYYTSYNQLSDIISLKLLITASQNCISQQNSSFRVWLRWKQLCSHWSQCWLQKVQIKQFISA